MKFYFKKESSNGTGLCVLCRAISSHVGGNFPNLQFGNKKVWTALFVGIEIRLLRDILGYSTMSISSKCV